MPAAELYTAPEAINQAGAFFLNRIPNWKDNLVPIIKKKDFSLSRPNSFLFLQLKIARLSESDFGDCLNMLKLEPVTPKQSQVLKGVLERSLKSPKGSDEFRERCRLLLEKLKSL